MSNQGNYTQNEAAEGPIEGKEFLVFAQNLFRRDCRTLRKLNRT